MIKQIIFIVDALRFIQGGKILTWRTPFLAIQYLIKIASERLGSLRAAGLKPITPENKGVFSFRLAGHIDDVQKAQRVYLEAFEDDYGAFLLEKLYKQFPQLFFITMNGDEMVGYCVYTMDPGIFTQERKACLYSIAIDSHYQGQGHARYMIEKTMAYLRQNSISSVYLHVRPENTKAIKLYESLGFKLGKVVKGINPKRSMMLLMETNLDGKFDALKETVTPQ